VKKDGFPFCSRCRKYRIHALTIDFKVSSKAIDDPRSQSDNKQFGRTVRRRTVLKTKKRNENPPKFDDSTTQSGEVRRRTHQQFGAAPTRFNDEHTTKFGIAPTLDEEVDQIRSDGNRTFQEGGNKFERVGG
jgi:hypothetical protein